MNASNEAWIRVAGVTRTFRGKGEDVTPLRDLDLEITQGDFVALMGPSGSGKTTLLHLLAGIDQPTAGRIQIGPTEVSGLGSRALARWRNENVGYVFQQYGLVPVLTAWENIELPLLLSRLSRSERDQRIQVALDAVGLTDRSTHLPRELSGGQQQRVAIARAIVGGPALLLADEPTGNLDAEAATAVLELLQTLHERFGQTLILVTHDPRAAGYARRTIQLDKGRVREASPEGASA